MCEDLAQAFTIEVSAVRAGSRSLSSFICHMDFLSPQTQVTWHYFTKTTELREFLKMFDLFHSVYSAGSIPSFIIRSACPWLEATGDWRSKSQV